MHLKCSPLDMGGRGLESFMKKNLPLTWEEKTSPPPTWKEKKSTSGPKRLFFFF